MSRNRKAQPAVSMSETSEMCATGVTREDEASDPSRFVRPSRKSRAKGRHVMVRVALVVRLEAKPGKEKEVESFRASIEKVDILAAKLPI